MSDYIKKEDAMSIIREAFSNVDICPSADVVEVVRCKDCKYSQFKDNGVLRPTAYCHRLNVIISGKGKGYCDLGERKDGKEGE